MSSYSLGYLKNLKFSYNNQINEYNQIISNNTEKIERLKTAKSALEDVKDSAGDIKGNWDDIYSDLDSDTDWSGDKRSDLGSCMMYDLRSDLSTYYDNLEAVIEDISEQISILQIESDDSFSLVDAFSLKINWVDNCLKYFK